MRKTGSQVNNRSSKKSDVNEFRLEHDLRHDLERLELVPFYGEMSRLKEKQRKYDSEGKHKLTAEEEKQKLLKQFKLDNERFLENAFI